MNYVLIYFLPGAGGNFFSRCLNYLHNSYCFANANTSSIPTSLVEKVRLLNFSSQVGKSFEQRNWVKDFESKVTHYSTCQEHWDLPPNSYSIWLGHSNMSTQIKTIAGEDDKLFNFIIDSSETFEWTMMNALYKNSYIDVQWFLMMEKFKQHDNYHKINLKNIINSQQGFLEEFEKVCSIIGHTVSAEEFKAVSDLYAEWHQTTLKTQDIPAFKKQIGFLM